MVVTVIVVPSVAVLCDNVTVPFVMEGSTVRLYGVRFMSAVRTKLSRRVLLELERVKVRLKELAPLGFDRVHDLELVVMLLTVTPLVAVISLTPLFELNVNVMLVAPPVGMPLTVQVPPLLPRRSSGEVPPANVSL